MKLQNEEENPKPLKFDMKEQLEKWLWNNASRLPSKKQKEKVNAKNKTSPQAT